MDRRPLIELIEKTDPAWPIIQEHCATATNHVEVLPCSEPNNSNALLATQVTTRSWMGAVIFETGGILIDHGWLRLLGSGSERLTRCLPEWNRSVGCDLSSGPTPFLLVADDAVGGFFAIDGGFLGAPGMVFYLAPDCMEWENLDLGYGDFLCWCTSGDITKFYSTFRWTDWQKEVSKISGDQAIFVYPPLWAKGPAIGERHRGVVPILEMFEQNAKTLPSQLGLNPAFPS